MQIKGKKQISSELFSFVCEQYLTNTPTTIIKIALKKCAELIDTLDKDHEEQKKQEQKVQEQIKNVFEIKQKAEEKKKEQEKRVSEKRKRKTRSDKGKKKHAK